MTIELREPNRDEFAALSELCMRSKAVWGYDKAFMEACRAELTLTPDDLRRSKIQVAASDGVVLGVVQVSMDGEIASLDKLFVEPGILRTGVGSALFDWARATAIELGAPSMIIDADPGAADFYRRMGARDDGIAPSESIPGRFLPRLVLDLR